MLAGRLEKPRPPSLSWPLNRCGKPAEAAQQEKTLKVPPKRAGEIPNFPVGEEYSRLYDIHMNYGGGRQGGISPSADDAEGACDVL